ncbi:MAG TPA: PQQ-binding-like beta-propeller repeat protein, partial [Gemmataceae bacterium]|nr:PQQ-binding-like beta-propeller repeat protein [Gemmataceae bacterium]
MIRKRLSQNLGKMVFLGVIGGLGLAAEPNTKVDHSNWFVFRGNPLQTGVVQGDLPQPLEIRWSFQTKDSVEGTAAIANGAVYIGSFDEHLYALDVETGKEKWKFKGGPFKTPVSFRNEGVYIGDAEGVFYCLEAATGKLRWKFNTESEITSGSNFAGDNVMFGAADETLYCLSKEGKELWKFKVPGGPVMGTPAVVGERTFVSGCDSSLHVLDTTTGKELHAVELEGQTAATPAVMGDTLYVG